MEISSIQQINYESLSSINTVNTGGVPFDFHSQVYFNMSIPNLISLSSVMTYDLSGSPTYYTIDISGAQNLSTLQSIQHIQELSTLEGTSTIEGISTMQSLSSLAAIEVNLDDIINSHNTLIEIESRNKTTLNSLDFNQFKSNLYKWAAQGYPDSFLAYSFPVNTPPMTVNLYNCSDGNPKNIWDYIPFCLNLSLQDWVNVYQQKVNGLKLSFSVNENPYVVNIHVTRV
jgi:hypothetical protein